MTSSEQCEKCGIELPVDAPQRLCPACLMAAGIELTQADSATPAVMNDQMPPVIPRYRIIQLIGFGGMGAVYEAEQDHPRRLVALKVIRAGLATQQHIRWFKHEADVLGRLQHPGIAQIYEYGTVPSGQPFFAMELIRGPDNARALTITEFAQHKSLTSRQRLDLIARVADAVHFAHQKGVIHRDLKPANILIDATGLPKVLDFGVARLINTDVQLTSIQTDIGQIVGTLSYMSPEQAAGDPLQLDTRSDVYGLGVICYELLAMRLPLEFKSRLIHEAVRVIREEEPMRLSTINRTFRGDIDTIVAKALEKEKDRRYQSAVELASDIRRFLDDQPIAARRPSAGYQLRKFAKRNKTLVGATVAVFVSLVLGVIGTSIGLFQASRQRDAATSARDAEQSQRIIAQQETNRAKQQEFLAQKSLYSVQMTLAGQMLGQGQAGPALDILRLQQPRGDARDLRGFEWYYLWRLCHQGHRFTLREHTGAVVAVAVSPDGKLFASGGSDRQVKIWDAATGVIRSSLAGHTSTVLTIAFSPDGKTLASGSSDKTIKLWDVSTATLSTTFEGHTGIVSSLAFSRNGATLASGSADTTVKLWEVATREVRNTLQCKTAVKAVAFSPDGLTLALGRFYSDVGLLDIGTGKERPLGQHRFSVTCIAFSSDGKSVVSGAQDDTVKLWDVQTGQEQATIEAGVDGVRSVAMSPDGQTLACGGDNGTAILMDLAGKLLQQGSHRDRVTSVAFSPDGKSLVSGSLDQTVNVWNVIEKSAAVEKSPVHVWTVAFSPDGKTLYSAADTELKSWDVGTGNEMVLSGGRSRLAAGVPAVFSPDGKTLVTEGVNLWDATTGELRARLERYESTYALAFSPNGKMLASGGHDQKVRLIDLESKQVLSTFTGHTGWVWGVAFSGDGATLASVSGEYAHAGELKFWDVATGREKITHRVANTMALLSPDGKTLVTGCNDGSMKLWDMATERQIGALRGHTQFARGAAFSPDGKTLASINTEGNVTFWDFASRQERATLGIPGHKVWSLAFSPDGSTLATGGRYGEVKLWRAATERDVQTQFTR